MKRAQRILALGLVLATAFVVTKVTHSQAPFAQSITQTPDGDWRITWSSVDGEDYIIQRSQDGETWSDVETVRANDAQTAYVDTTAPAGMQLLWRVVGLGPGGTGEIDISEVLPEFGGGGSSGGGGLTVQIEADIPIDSVVYFDGNTELGEAVPGPGGTWFFPLDIDPDSPRIVDLSLQVNPSEGDPVMTDPLGLLAADTTRYVPLDEDGAPIYGGLIPASAGTLGRFAFYPEGFTNPQSTTGAHFVFEPGSTLVDAAGGATFSFSDGAFHRGLVDLEPLPTRSGIHQIDLNSVSPDIVLLSFDNGTGASLSLLWEGNEVGWTGGELVEAGWAALQLLPPIEGLVLPDGHGEIAIRVDPDTAETYLVICFHGSWAAAEGGTSFSVPQSDPLKVYLFPDGRIDVSGTAEAVFPDGATLRGSIAWRDPAFEVRIEGKGFTIPAFTTLRDELPSLATAAIPDGVREGELDSAARQLEGMRDALRGLAAGSAGQADTDSDTSYDAPAAPGDSAGAALRAWAGRLVSWEVDREGDVLPTTAMVELASLLRGAGKTGEGAYDVATPLSLLVEVLRINGSIDAAIDGSTEAADLLDAIAEAEARLFAAAQRLAVVGGDAENSLAQALLLERVEEAAAFADATGRAPRGGETERDRRIQQVRAVLKEINQKVFLENLISRPDTDGSDNVVLTQKSEEELLKLLAQLLGVMKIFGKTEITQTLGVPFPIYEGWDQSNDVFFAKHRVSTTAALASKDFGALRRVLAHRARFLNLQFEFGRPVHSDTGTFLVGGNDGFQTTSDALIEAFTRAQGKLPGATVAETCAVDLRMLYAFRDATQDGGERIGFGALWDRASACEKVLTAQSDAGAICEPVATALRAAGMPFEAPVAGDEGDRMFRISGLYESTSVSSANPVTLQLNQAGRLVMGRIHYHGGPNSESLTRRIFGMLAAETNDGVAYSVLIRDDDGSGLLGGGREREHFIVAGPNQQGQFELQLRPGPSDEDEDEDEEPVILNRFRRANELPAHSEVLRNFLPAQAQEVFDARHKAPLHSAQVEDLRDWLPSVVSQIDAYLGESEIQGRRAQALNVGRRLETATRKITLSQLPLARQIVCEELSRQNATLNGEEISYWNMIRIIYARHRNDNQMEPFRRFMGPAVASDYSGINYKYTVHIQDANIGLFSFGVKIAAIEIRQERADGIGGFNDFMLAGALGQGGVGASLTKYLEKYGGGGGSGTADSIVYSDVEYSEQSLAGPVAIIGATAGAGLGLAELQVGPSVLMLYGDGTLPPLAVPLPLVDGGNNLVDAGVEMSFGLGYVGSWSEVPPAQFSFSSRPTERRFSGEAGISGAVHFDSGAFEVRDCGRSELRLLVAEMLAIFESEDASISILGFTDATGPDDPAESDTYNLNLSQQRANTVQALLSDLAGDRFSVKPENFRSIGLGRYPAMNRSGPPGVNLTAAEQAFVDQKKSELGELVHDQGSQAWRTVSIILNNLVRIDLSGPEVN